MRTVIAAAIVLLAPAAHAWDNNFRVKNCDSKRVRICSYDASDATFLVPAKTDKIKSGKTDGFGCNDGVYKDPNVCQVHIRRGDTSGCGKAKTAKKEHFEVDHDKTIYVWFHAGERKWAYAEPAGCGSL